MSASIRTLSQLPKISSEQLTKNALFEVSQPVEIEIPSSNDKIIKYASKSITKDDLSKKIISDVRSDLTDKNGLTDDLNFTDLNNSISNIANKDFVFDGNKTFLKTPKINNDFITDYSNQDESLNEYSVNFNTLKKYSTINNSPLIGPKFGFITELYGIQSDNDTITNRKLNLFKINDNNEATNEKSFLFDLNVKNIAQTEYVFRINQNERESNTWTAPASGIFTCYGWIDEMNNQSQSNESRWVALLGKQTDLGEWAILQVQPFIKNNYLSYVSFTFPVKVGMELKVVTGFSVGSNSDKYFATTTGLANHLANSFLGGVYTGLSTDNGQGYNYNFTNIDTNYVSQDELNDYSKKETVDQISSITDKLTTDIEQISNLLESNGTQNDKVDHSKFTKFIDSQNYSNTINKDNSSIRYVKINIGNGKLSDNKIGVFKDKVLQFGWYGRNNKNNSFNALSTEWILFNNNNEEKIIKVYIPKDQKTVEEDGEMILHANDNAIIPLAGGEVFSDGKHIYYCVSQDSTVIINLLENIVTSNNTNYSTYTICRLLYGQKNADKWSDISTTPILSHFKSYSDNGPGKRISIPLKRGNVLMFSLYMRKSIQNSSEADNFIQSGSIESIVNDDIKMYDLINNKYDVFSDTFVGNANGNPQKTKLNTYLIRADGKNITDVVDDENATFNEIVKITELP